MHPFLPDTDDTPDKDKIHAMRMLVNSVADGRWEQTRPPSNAELSESTPRNFVESQAEYFTDATGVIRVRVHSASAKLFGGDTGSQIAAVRVSLPSFNSEAYPRSQDLTNEDLTSTIWTGVM